MNATPLVSVLVRTKDRKPYLLEAINSVLRQSYSPLEIIIVNDGGGDFSESATGAGSGTDIKISWIDNEGDHGRSHAANLALDAAQGEFCLFLDDDDWLDDNHIENLVGTLQQNPDFEIAYSAVRVVENNTPEPEPSFAYPYDPIRLLIENYIPIHAVLFNRRFYLEGCRFDPAFDRFEDWDFWLQLSQKAPFIFSNKCTANYRIEGGSGFGVKDEDDVDGYRIAIYRKWRGLWTDEQVLAVIGRSREFPRIKVLHEAIENAEKNFSRYKTHVTGQLQARDKQLEEKGEFISKLQANNQRLQEANKEKDERILSQQAHLAGLTVELQETEHELLESEMEVKHHKEMAQALQNELNIILSSKSWRLTRPLRAVTKARYIYRHEGFGGLAGRIMRRISVRWNRVRDIKSESPVKTHYKTLAFHNPETPRVSIVIPVYNKFKYTFHCLESVLNHSGDIPYEIIVVDDQSTDETGPELAKISGITVIRNKENLGFIGSCNHGAAKAGGEFLVLLNNDTEVKDGWLEALLATFNDFPDAGLVGARLVFPDGKLQEAGGIVWRDGSAWNYGRNDDPNKPEYSYCREADYCSGACLMISLADFNALGGFDTHYSPAYYEDTDLAFRIRDMGKKVYYQPRSTVIHFEGITSGTDEQSGVKKYQQLNHKKFFERWQETLADHRPNGRLPHLEKERHVLKRALVIDARVLMPDHDSGSLRMFNLLKILQKTGYKVTFVPSNLHYHEKYTPAMQAAGIECLYLPYVRSIEKYLEENGQIFNVALLSRADYAEKHIDAVKKYCTNARILFDTVDLHFLREQRLAELQEDKLLKESADTRKIQELTIARKAHKTLVVSPVEIELFRQEAPDVDVCLLTNIHELHETGTGFGERKDILFIGSFEHPPNTDAMHYFIDDIFPLVHAERPGINLLIAGDKMPGDLRKKASANIHMLGFVDDIQPLFDGIRLSIAPLRYGAGVKGKINSSMSYGVPVVATSIAAEGMGLVHEKDVLIADTPEDFARQVIRLYDDEALWNSLSRAGRENIEQYFSFAVAEEQLRAVLPD